MKLDSFMLVSKAACYFLIGFGTPLSAGLVPWVNSHEFPDEVTWVALIIAAVVGGATSMLAFFSGTYSDYVRGRSTAGGGGSQANDTANQKPPEPKP